MASHGAIRDSIVEMSRRVGRYNLDVPEMKRLMEYVERSTPGAEFTDAVRSKLAPVAQHIPAKNIDEIAKVYPDFPLRDVAERVPPQEREAVWQALGMTNMLLTTIQMVPPEMMSQIETMTSTMMSAMQQGGGLNELFKNMGSLMGGGFPAGDVAEQSSDDDALPEPVASPRPRKKKGSKQQEFRNKLC